MNRLALAFLGVLASASVADAATLYATTPIGSSVRSSDYGSLDGGGYRSYDNFRLDDSASIESLSWTFLFTDLTSPYPAPAPAPDVNQWLVSFHADASGTPGSELAAWTFAAADVTSTALGTEVWDFGGFFSVSNFEFAVDLPSALSVEKDTVYWLSVVSVSSNFYPLAGWLAANDGLGDSSYQAPLGAGMVEGAGLPVVRDRAFSLEGRVVPEPATVLLMATGLGAAIIRRKKA